MIVALTRLSPRFVLAIISLPGIAFHIIYVGTMIYYGGPGHTESMIARLPKALTVMLVVDIMLFGMPLVPIFVMVGVVISLVRRKQALTRWTPASVAALGWIILSYAIGSYINYNFNLP